MVGYVFLGLCLLAALFLAGKALLSVDPAKLATALRLMIVGVMGAAAVFLMVTGRFALGAPMGILALAMLKRWSLPNLKIPFPSFGGRGRGSSGQQSTVNTDFIRMSLAHSSGEMHGQVLRGTFAGRELTDLSLAQLLAVLDECELEDAEGAQLLETYLDRIHDGWRELGEQGAKSGRGWGRRKKSAANDQMTMDEAREILGVEPDASTEEIKQAHHRLIRKNHPDQGGSDFLAAKINQAKDLLLDS